MSAAAAERLTHLDDTPPLVPSPGDGCLLLFKARRLTPAEAWERHSNDIEAATAAAGHNTIQGFRNAATKAKVKLGNFAYDCVHEGPTTATKDPWTPEASAVLADLWLRRPMLPLQEIARRLGRAGTAVQSAASRFGLPGRDTTPLDALAAVRRRGRLRKCMCDDCRRTFFSDGPWNRLCELHRRGDGVSW